MHDVLIVGAGVAGLYQLHRARELGLDAHVVDAGSDVGGTWHWNRYPGARFDSESYTYAYSFSEELLDEWKWSEHFAGQPETERYLKHVADRFDLRRDITFGRRVTSMRWDGDRTCWQVGLDDGTTVDARFVVMAVGFLSVPNTPDVEGIDEFEGPSFHTYAWPPDAGDLPGQRVGVIGTGATAVQVIQELARSTSRLTVFQRTPSWCSPLRNARIAPEEQVDLRARADEMFERCRNTYGGFLHDSDRRKAMEVSEDVRIAFYEELYERRGFGVWMGNFRDCLVDPQANATLSAFMADKIRSRVDDPATAELLIPTDHGYGTRRVPLETDYYECFNRPNVELVDLRSTPIVRADATGLQTTAAHHDLDTIVFATGFDALTGPFERIDVEGTSGEKLADAWRDGPRTYLGVSVAGFPNLFITAGPHNVASFCNATRCLEHNIDFICDLITHVGDRGGREISATPAAQDEWTAEVIALADRMLLSKVQSWFTGKLSASHPGETTPRVLLYTGGFVRFRERCELVKAEGFAGFEVS